jgi:hypothetical protein
MKLQNTKRAVSAKGIVPIRLAILIVLAPALCLGYLSLDSKCETMGKELKALDREIVDLNRKCLNEELRWMSMKSPGEIDKALRRWHLTMTWPDEQQIVRVSRSDMNDALEPGRRMQRITQYVQVGRIRVND